MKQLCVFFVMSIMWSPALSAQQPLRIFRLQFQLADFVVPAGETWQLRWRAPYRLGEICPGYDVRVINGPARIGDHGELQAQPFGVGAKTIAPLDLSATAGEVSVWLESGATFSTANDLLKIEVRVFPNTP
jgi:hypothetical protein